MLGKTPAVLCLEHDDVFTEESALNSSFEVEQRHTSHQQALLRPTLPPFLHQLRLVVQFLFDEVRHRGKVILTSSPTVGRGFPLGLRQIKVAGAVHALD